MIEHGERESALSMTAELGEFWWKRRILTEGISWYRRTLENADDLPDSLRARARTYVDEACGIFQALGIRSGVALSHEKLARFAAAEGDLGRARLLYEKSLAIFRELGDDWAIATVLRRLGSVIIAAAVMIQRMSSAKSGAVLRIAIHFGPAEARGGDYFGPALNRSARLLSSAHGGQIVVSTATEDRLRGLLPPGIRLRPLGEHRLKDLERPETIFQVDAEELPSEFPPLRSLNHRPNNLPVVATPFIGRETDVADIRRLLRTSEIRMLSLIGTGGVGKTRLSLQAAAEAFDDFPDGVFLVPLELVRAPDLFFPAVARALSVAEKTGQSTGESLSDHLRSRRILLLLDNFEQLLAAAPLLRELLAEAPDLKLIVTSRSALSIPEGDVDLRVVEPSDESSRVKTLRAKAHHWTGMLAHDQGDDAGAVAAYEESLAKWRRIGDRGRTALVLDSLGFILREAGETDRAEALHRESYEIFRELGDSRGMAVALTNLAEW